MTRRILGIVSFLLAALMVANVIWLVAGAPFDPAARHGGTGGNPFAMFGILLLLTAAMASACNGIHLQYGSAAGSPLRRMLHISNLVYAAFAGLYALLIHFTVAYQASTMNMPLRDYLAGHLPALAPLPIVAIYLVLLFWRGAVADLPRR
jgi:cytochrome bd-type quinol oxidase subunit 2